MGVVQESFPERVMSETEVNLARGHGMGCISGECSSWGWNMDTGYQEVGES